MTPTVRPDPEYLLLLVALVGTTITPYVQMFQQDAVVEGSAAAELPYTRADVITGCVFASLVSIFIIIATAATLYVDAVEAGLPGAVIETAADAARALEPVAGSYATQLFGIGIFGASMLAPASCPWPPPAPSARPSAGSGVDQEPGEAPSSTACSPSSSSPGPWWPSSPASR